MPLFVTLNKKEKFFIFHFFMQASFILFSKKYTKKRPSIICCRIKKWNFRLSLISKLNIDLKEFNKGFVTSTVHLIEDGEELI